MGRHCRSRSALDRAATIGPCLDSEPPDRTSRAATTSGRPPDGWPGPDRRPRRPDARRRARARPGRSRPGPTSPAGSRWSRAARQRTRPAGSAGSGRETTLISAVGRDAAGRALVDAVRADGVTPRVRRVAGARTGRIGVFVAPGGERRFVADRGAADLLRPARSPPAGSGAPTRSTCRPTRCSASRSGWPAAGPSSSPGPPVHSSASISPRSVRCSPTAGRRPGRSSPRSAPDLLFATAAEAEALLGRQGVEGLLELAPIAVVKRGSKGATVLAAEGGRQLRFEVATQHRARRRHDRRRRRVRCRVPRRLVRRARRPGARWRRRSSGRPSPATGRRPAS